MKKQLEKRIKILQEKLDDPYLGNEDIRCENEK